MSVSLSHTLYEQNDNLEYKYICIDIPVFWGINFMFNINTGVN